MEKYEEQYFEIPNAYNPKKKIFVLAKNVEEAQRKAKLPGSDNYDNFTRFRNIYKHLQEDALILADWQERYVRNMRLNRRDRIRCFNEALLRVFYMDSLQDCFDVVGWKIIDTTDEIIQARNKALIEAKK